MTVCCYCKEPREPLLSRGKFCASCWIGRLEAALREIAAGHITRADRTHPGGEYFAACSRFREIAQNALDSPRTRKESVR